MTYELARNAADQNHFNVERITEDGACEMAIFAGPNAEVRACAYLSQINATAE